MQTQIVIGGILYNVNPLLIEDSFDLQPKLAPVLPEVAKLLAMFYGDFEAIKTLDTDNTIDTKTFLLDVLERVSPIVQRIAQLLPAADLRHIRRTLLRGATCAGKALYDDDAGADAQPINVLMAGKTIDLWILLGHAIKVSYPDFFAKAGSVVRRQTKGASSEGSNA